MIKLAVAIVVAAVLVIASSASAAPKTSAGYCDETGDICAQLQLRGSTLHAVVTYAIRLSSAEICVTPPGKKTTCVTRPVRKVAPNTYVARRTFAKPAPGVWRIKPLVALRVYPPSAYK